MTPTLKPRARKAAAPFSVRDALSRSNEALARPPLVPHIERPQIYGQCLMRFALPLSVLQPQNRTRHAQPWKLGKMKAECLALMRSQLPTRLELPLPGRPQVLCVRFSSVEPDKYNDGFKIAVDCLVKLGLLVDDAPRFVDLHQWWEPAPPKLGFGVVEVWSGKGAA
jgi:hypothetical protein